MAFITALVAGAAVAAGVGTLHKRNGKQKQESSPAADLARRRPFDELRISPERVEGAESPSLSPQAADSLLARVQQAGARLVRSIEVSSSDSDVASVDQWAGTHFAISTTSLVLAVGSAFMPILRLPSVIGLTFVTIPLGVRAWSSWRKERKLTMPAVWTFFLPFSLVSGHLLAVAFSYWLALFSLNVVANVKGRTLDQMINIFGEHPSAVWVRRDGYEIEVPFDSVTHDDIVIVHAGQMIPVDGVVVEGMAGVDQRMLTGESQPAEKQEGDTVFAATVVLSGRIGIQVQSTGAETVAAQIGQILNDTTNYAADVELRGIQLADRTALPNLALSALALPIAGSAGALAILLLPLGDALYLGGPLGVLNYLSNAARQGLLIKDGRVLELLRQVDTVVFDKTGTLTEEQPTVSAIYACNSYDEAQILTFAAAAEHKQSHPIARAIQLAAQEAGLALPPIEQAQVEMGLGVQVRLAQGLVRVGSQAFMQSEDIPLPPQMAEQQALAHAQGRSLVYVALEEELIGALELQATIRPEAQALVDELHNRGYAISILSGDQEEPTAALAQTLSIDRWFSQTRPEHKADVIARLQAEGKTVCFVGDGINDAIALKTAQVSVSLAGASTVATDTAQVVLMDGNLAQLVQLFDLAAGLNGNLRRTFIAGAAASAAIVGGVFVLHIGLPVALTLNALGMAASFGNAMQPALAKVDSRSTAPRD